ncbi:hypothetical protein ACFPZK_10940 [Psychrobacter urativorans]|uniref:hypothetical protein n=1 Tax=Psychrobacter urativorans TaxID=45610 RepID=UPI00191AF05E|nr:hypothetical protein [Psychrobacter urativorans]
MTNDNPSYVPISNINDDLSLSLSRRLRLSYYLDWLRFFSYASDKESPHSEEIIEFIYFWREEIRYIVEEAIFNQSDFDQKRVAYHRCYEEIMSDFNRLSYIPQSIYKVETIIRAIASLQLAYTAFNNTDFYISLWYQQAYDSNTLQLRRFNGFDSNEVQDKGWRKPNRGSNIAQYELMDKGVSIALSVLNDDKEKNLTSTDIATIVRKCLKSIQDNKVPDIKQIRENWLTDKRFDERKKKGRPKGKAEDREKIRENIIKNIINNYQHGVG